MSQRIRRVKQQNVVVSAGLHVDLVVARSGAPDDSQIICAVRERAGFNPGSYYINSMNVGNVLRCDQKRIEPIPVTWVIAAGAKIAQKIEPDIRQRVKHVQTDRSRFNVPVDVENIARQCQLKSVHWINDLRRDSSRPD